MAVSDETKSRIAAKLKERNKIAREINLNMRPSEPVKILRAKDTVEILYRERDAQALEATLDVFLEAPNALAYRGRKSYSTAEMAELMEIAAQSRKKAEEDVGFYKKYVREVGVTEGGLPSIADPIHWSDHITQFVYKYKDPEEFSRPEQYRDWKNRIYKNGLGLSYEYKWQTEYKQNFINVFKDRVIGHIPEEYQKPAIEILKQLEQVGGEQYRDAYFTDLLGTIKDIYAENYEEAVDAAQRTARIFGFKVPY